MKTLLIGLLLICTICTLGQEVTMISKRAEYCEIKDGKYVDCNQGELATKILFSKNKDVITITSKYGKINFFVDEMVDLDKTTVAFHTYSEGGLKVSIYIDFERNSVELIQDVNNKKVSIEYYIEKHY